MSATAAFHHAAICPDACGPYAAVSGISEGTHSDRPRKCDLLQAGGSVDRISGHDAVPFALCATEVDQGVTGFDTDAEGQLWPALRAKLGHQSAHRRLHLQRGTDGALGIVLVDRRHAEDGQHRVAGEFLDRPLITGDLGGQAVERA